MDGKVLRGDIKAEGTLAKITGFLLKASQSDQLSPGVLWEIGY